MTHLNKMVLTILDIIQSETKCMNMMKKDIQDIDSGIAKGLYIDDWHKEEVLKLKRLWQSSIINSKNSIKFFTNILTNKS